MVTIPQESTASRQAASDSEYLSSQLIAILTKQVSLARRGKVDEVLTLAGEIDQLMCRADRKQLREVWSESPIRGLYDELQLIFGAAKGEVAGELDGVRKGKTSLRAYKNISG